MTGEFVSHVTGFGTRVGITMGHDDFLFGFELLFIPISFILGAIVTSFILDKKDGCASPSYHKVQALYAVFIGIILVMGYIGLIDHTSSFGSDNRYTPYEILTLFLLCFVCGLKNGLVAWTTYGKIRVTHLTGLSTDIGLNFIGMFWPGRLSERFKEPTYVNIIRIMILLSFSSGAFVSAILFPFLGFEGLWFPFVTATTLTMLAFKDYRKWCHPKP
jgi:uncharacterized membrane protein YoaK (UPF0700 family)